MTAVLIFWCGKCDTRLQVDVGESNYWKQPDPPLTLPAVRGSDPAATVPAHWCRPRRRQEAMTATVWRAVAEFTDDAGVLHTREVPCVRGIDISQSGHCDADRQGP